VMLKKTAGDNRALKYLPERKNFKHSNFCTQKFQYK